jgi:rhodanese-related sulfurtransferase
MALRRTSLTAALVLFLIFMLLSAVTLTAKMKNINTSRAHDLIEDKNGEPDFVILDIRTPEEYAEGHIENAVNVDFYDDAFPDELSSLDTDKTYLIYCRSGGRSGSAFKMMKELGFRNVYNMEGGIIRWRKSYSVVH